MNEELQCRYYQGWMPSTHEWCEDKLCSWIREPSNTWSNLGFIIIGIWILLHCRKLKYDHLKLLGVFSILVGLMSGFYHATSSFVGEVLDYSSMFLISTYFLSANLARLLNWDAKHLRVYAFGIVFVSVVGLIYLETVGAMFFGVQIFIAIVLEYYLFRRAKEKPHYTPFLKGIACFLLAYLIWNLDTNKIVCDPDNHLLTGHAVWHLLNAVAIWFIFKFYSQFELKYERKI